MITQETAARIFNCYREIEAAKKLLEDVREAQQKNIEEGLRRDAPVVKDAFGRKQNLEMGIPRGDSSKKIFEVSPDLAISVMRSHIATMEAQLVELNEQARIQLGEESAEIKPSQKTIPVSLDQYGDAGA